MADRISYFRQKGDPFVLGTGLALILTLGMVIFIISVILVKGLGFFWPNDLIQTDLPERTYLGELWDENSKRQTDQDGHIIEISEFQLKIGNRELYGSDFVWIEEAEVVHRKYPLSASTFERYEFGNFYGYIRSVQIGDSTYSQDPKLIFERTQNAHDIALDNRSSKRILEEELNNLITPLAKLQREISLYDIETSTENQAKLTELKQKAVQLENEISEKYLKLSDEIQLLVRENEGIYVRVESADGKKTVIHLSDVVRFYQPNDMNLFQKSTLYISKLWEFISANPRESNTEGGVFPAIFGTVLMVLLMSIAVVPFGVLAALYLNEYAKQGTVIRLIRLSVNNLAGVPSIVFGIFGLGFFIYMVGGTIDQVFFSDKLPEPTFGTGGILWASLTLALLTLPVVVVATEEGILAVPRANKEGALALGATRWQMVRKIILPNAMPGILTGLILAISRGAGEVAPLMITGVVKLAPSLALDGAFPFLHLDRKFMHLGFHIYDVGFQSPNVEAAKPMVYTTALLLIFLVICLNLLAIYMRNRLRKKYKTAVF